MTRPLITARAALTLAFAPVAIAALPAAHAQSASYRPLVSAEPLQDRIAYLLTLFEKSPEVQHVLFRDPALRAVRDRLVETRSAVQAACAAADATSCPVERLMLGEGEIETVASVLVRLAVSDPAVASLVSGHVRPSGRYQLHAHLSDPELLAAAWRDAARAINRVYRLYALGEKPAYPAIDGLDREAALPRFQGRLGDALAMRAALGSGSGYFGSVWSVYAVDLLILAQRDEAARYEPLDAGLNRTANHFARGLRWGRYRYSAILVPGNGLEPGEKSLSAIAVLRLRLAAERWRAGQAPLIILSGGHVHPNRSPHAEAIEMKAVLMKRYGVPERAILTDPYARHTTTNLRNAVRLLFRAGAPMDKPLLVTTSVWQTQYIADPGKDGLAERSRRELGYPPYSDPRTISPVEASVMPDLRALHTDPNEPLDP
ncbi:YdcF family protein [Sphingomonas colocasiae]|uniref:YdcF family protein n=1 Tax=Sphingomonas colocasiae TaxID=1848973 RepID=A0ABS7Q1P6_9SPHN|nr:YdcF family protein [Sphingomonas colocasiae]MBY8823322.1 YdcF family protein [Sphingomonas colocasiae]MBY8826457.1 YdcF family protein [Sphingomonas colocasiae]